MSLDAPTPMGTDALGQTDERKMSLRWQDDRERWSKERVIDLGLGGDLFPTVRLFRLGLYRTRQWELVCPTSILQCVVAVEEDAEVLR